MQEQKVIVTYNPLPKQLEFHKSPAKYRLYIGAWRAGKTYAGCYEAYKQSTQYNNNCGIICRKDFTDLRDTTIKTLFEIIPPELIKEYNKTEHHLVLKNGSEIYFKHLKDGLKLGSLNLGWAYIDETEEVDEQTFQYLKGRLSLNTVKRQCLWLTSNPPNKDHWLYKHFEENIDNEDVATVHASTYENKANLPVDYISSLERMPSSWRKKYLEGHYGFTADGKPFYDGFKEYLHKRQLKLIPDKLIYRSWDFGFHHPAVSFHQIDGQGKWLILRELMGSDITIEKFGSYIKTYCAENFFGYEFEDFGDPAGKHPSDKDEKSSIEILASLGIYVTVKLSSYRTRKEIIERRLTNWIGDYPSILVNESCKTIIDGFSGGYHYPVRKPGQQFNPHLMECPFRDGYYEHLMNTVEYFAVNMFDTAETKIDNTEVSYKVTGELKDIHFDDDDEQYSSNYSKILNGVG